MRALKTGSQEAFNYSLMSDMSSGNGNRVYYSFYCPLLYVPILIAEHNF